MCFSAIFGGGNSDSKIAEQQRADEVARQARIKEGMSSIDSAFSGFNDAYYKKRAQDYIDYATPGFEKQAGQAHDNLVYALSRTGNLDSLAAIKKNADLTEETDAQRIGIANTGLDQANTARAGVENSRGNVVAELNATGDSSAAAATALRTSQNLAQPQGYSPLGNLFANFASTLGSIGSNSGNNYGGFFGGGGQPLFSSSGSGSQRVVGR